ncbi:guanylate-binding protein 1-like [Lacerta agilis]|uniref:guanylate-binding protein 1-like n=1 Tax=Lacerta agilis TaxID=80427 RepID=UPI0014193141|nr:guanylate-binding protein 1-like [Lacerta agilis]
MAPGQVHMAAPVCLIENMPDGKLVVNREAAELLARIRQPVVVVAIVGLYRTGKSYLMNRLAGKRKGFCLGATVQGLTKGIWMWCLPHPHRPDLTLLLLDTEGLGDVQKGNTQNDLWIFALAILLSSTLVYNSIGTIDQNALENLHYVTELTKKIKAKASSGEDTEEENSTEFVRFFPDFIWAVRDFTLQLEIDGHPVTDDGYLENALRLQKGNTEQIQRCNMPRSCIRRFFPSRKCFTFDRPASRKKLSQLEELEEDDLEEDFLEPVGRFCQHIWETSRPKTVPGGQVVTGIMLQNLTKTYVNAINSGDLPCLENAVLALAEIENAAAVCDAISSYEEQMGQRLKLPTATVNELLAVHAECEREATGIFMARAFGDELVKTSQKKLEQELKQKKEEFCRKNEQASLDRCFAVLTDLSQELEDELRMGIYSVPGGYQRYLEKRDEVEKKYHLVPEKGIQADKALEEFLKSKQTVANSLLQMDHALTDKEKEIEAQRAQAEAAQLQQKLLEQEQARLKQMVEDEKRSHDEQLQLLNEKMEQEKKLMEVETIKMIQHKLKEQEELLKEGFQQRANEMESEIQRLKEESQNSKMALVLSAIEKGLSAASSIATQLLQYRMQSNMLSSALNQQKSESPPKSVNSTPRSKNPPKNVRIPPKNPKK